MKTFTTTQTCELLNVSRETLRRWEKSGKLVPLRNPMNRYKVYTVEQLRQFEDIIPSLSASLETDNSTEAPIRKYTSIELFAGAGGLALGLEQAGLTHSLLSELDKDACTTLRINRPEWHVIEGDVAEVDFTPWENQIDVVTGGFPCQAFSYAGKRLGLEDARGTMFYEFARCVKETQPLICIGENVRGLLRHDEGKTIETMLDILDELGYEVLQPKLLRAIHYSVPQKRERVFIVGIRKGSGIKFNWPMPNDKIYNLKDALKAGSLYSCDVPLSVGQSYPESKKKVMDLIPPGGYWRDLPINIQKEYMKKSFYLGGGKTGMARRISWDEPSLTLTCSPAQKQTERCHPDETRPFTVREYARIQTFPDDWEFAGSMTSQYKQIGNAVPINLAKAIGHSVVQALNEYYEVTKSSEYCDRELVNQAS